MSSPDYDADDDDAPIVPVGTEIAGYRLDDVIASGTMSTVYRATQIAPERPVALKLVSALLAQNESVRDRFVQEWRMAGALEHPSILPVHDAGEEDGNLYLVMDLVTGGDLTDRINRDGPLPPETAVPILEQIAGALDTAHAAGLVHRDVKPGNILLDGDRAFLVDFGLSKFLNSTHRLTAPGHTVGTAAYLAPEQIRGQAVDARTDVYGLGCVFFDVLAGAPPYEAESDYVLMYAHMDQPVPKLSERAPNLPKEVDAVAKKAMAKRREGRYASPGEAVAALRTALGL